MGKFKTRKRENNNFNTPQEMYDDYKNRKIEGIHDYQSNMIDLYMKKADKEKDIALELPTGTGKTLIGLLIGEFRRRKHGERVIYLCPNNQLVNQTVEYARKKYGIKAIGFTGSAKNYDPKDKMAFLSNQSIGITNYSSLFNTNTFFKEPDIIIFDDAHSGESYISSNWTVSINRHQDKDKDKDLYYLMVEHIKTLIDDSIYNKLLNEDPTSDDKSWFDKIPNLKLVGKYSSIRSLIDNYIKANSTDIKYPWSNIRENLYACNFFLSWNEIVIRPYIPPTLTYAPFTRAKQRIYMSATPGKSGELERAFGVHQITRLPMVKDWENKTIGRKFFMFPLASFSASQTGEIIKKITDLANRVLMIVKDNDTQIMVQDFLNKYANVEIFTGKDIEVSKQGFISSENGFAIVANRFDGIDFPNDECRMLILFDLPNATHLQEKFLITRMAAMTLFEERIKTRVVQALGRCTRSNTDYAAVCIFGDELTSSLLSPSKLKYFNPELQAELLFGQDNSAEQDNMDEYLELLDVFLNDREEWFDAEEDIISRRNEIIEKSHEVDNSDYEALMNSCKNEVFAQYAIWKEDYLEALKHIDSILHKLNSDALKGYRGFWYYIGACCAYNICINGDKTYEKTYRQYLMNASKATSSINWFNKIVSQDKKGEDISHGMEYVIENIEQRMLKFSKIGVNKFYDELNRILNLLKDSNGEKFEKGHEELGQLLGYKTINPNGDAEPDPIWVLNDKFCIVSEDKIYDSSSKPIPPRHIRQASSHNNWVNSNTDKLSMVKEPESIIVFITNSNIVDKSAAIHGGNVFYLNRDIFIEYAEKSIEVLKEIRRNFSNVGDLIWRENVIQRFIENLITPNDFIKLITQKKISDLG